MEKTNAEIATLAMLLKSLNIKAGARKADCRPVIEKLDEHIDAFVKAAVEEGYAESEESHLPEVFPRADIRTAEFEEDIRRRAEYPESLFPMATDILCRRVEDWFRRELLFYVSDIELAYGLKVEVSGLLTSSFSSDSMAPVSKQEAYIEKVQQLQQEGWTYQANHGSMELVDCPTNHVKIRQVVDSLGGRLYEALLQRDRIQKFSFRIPSDQCRQLFHQLSGEAPEEKKPESKLVTEDDEAVIKKAVKDIQFTLSSINIMDDRSIILSLLRSYTETIETILGFNDLRCFNIVKARHAEEARKNCSLQERQDKMSEAALEGLDMWDAYEKIETGLQKAFYTLGMRVSDLRASSYATTRFSAMPRTYYKECALREDLEFLPEPGDRSVYLINTPENILNLQNALWETMPRAKIEKIESAMRGHGQVVKKIDFTISPADIAKLLEKTKDLEEAPDF